MGARQLNPPGKTLVVTLSMIVIPLLAHAEGDETPLAPRRLTIQGRPLWQLRASTPGGFVLTGLPGQDAGAIHGVAVDAGGQPFAEQVTTSTTDSQGRFSFTELAPSDYEIDVLRGSDVIASALVALTDGMMVVEGLRVTEPIGDRVVYSFHDLGQRAETGWTVEVLDRQGNEPTGDLEEILGSSLTVAVDGALQTFEEENVLRVSRPPRGRSQVLGGLIGFGIGLGIVAGVAGACSAGGDDACGGGGSAG